jgi:hypothetical protein
MNKEKLQAGWPYLKTGRGCVAGKQQNQEFA